ncbi:MAG TPA: aminoglycoside phosphotransferase family protein [Ktedonobacterales bacterium]|jgi:spectinomycin phosphotransferase
MLTPPDLSPDVIAAYVRDVYRVDVTQVTFLPIGADADAAVYRLDSADGTAYFLKLRRARFDEIAVAVPAFLHERGAPAVMAPLLTTGGALWTSGHGFAWILYPFFDGPNGFERPLSDAQWLTLGESLRAVHSAILPATLAARIPREDYSPRWRDIVTAYSEQVERDRFADPIAERLASGWREKQEEIATLVERAAGLAQELRERSLPFVLCHTDLHAGNVLLGADGELAIVDWDDPILAPKERDLMFFGAGVGAIWDTPREEALFYQGYGPVKIDLTALAYYRNERIVADFASYGQQVFGMQGGVEDREDGVRRVMGQFEPGRVIEIAHRTYQRLT